MSRIEREFAEYDSQKQWATVYQNIKDEASIQSITDQFSVREARKPENRSRNRYRDVSPYDHSRVVLQGGETDYINASLITVPQSNRKYILSQGPLEHTAGQFWQMVWEQKSKAVVMLNRVIEKGTLKCHQYWPIGEHNDGEDEVLFEDVGLRVTLISQQQHQHYLVSMLDLENMQTGDSREVFHFHYVTWPDFGVPSSPTAFLNFLKAVRQVGVLEPKVGPAVIHCSAGIGRSGTFCLVDSSLIIIEESGSLDSVDVKSLLLNMRSYRMGLIQTPDQLRFSYLAIIEGGRNLVTGEDTTALNNVVEAYINMSGNTEEAPPKPPVRTTSLSPSKTKEGPPPPPPHRGPPTNDIGDTVTAVNGEAREKLSREGDEEAEDGEMSVPRKPVNLPQMQSGDTGADSMLQGPGETVPQGQDSPAVPTGQTNFVANTEDNAASEAQLRRRRREERKKNTQELIRHMKEKQRESETWKKRRSYFKPIAIGLTLLIGGLLLYKYYW